MEIHPNLLDFTDLDEEEIARYIRGVKADEIADNLPDFVQWLRNYPMITIEQPQRVARTPTTIFPLTNQFRQFTLTTQPTKAQQPTQPTQLTQPTQTRGGNMLTGVTVVFSGFRDKDLEDRIRRQGGKVTGSVSRNTTFLIMKDVNPESMKGKAQEAQAKGIPLITRDQFIKQYLL